MLPILDMSRSYTTGLSNFYIQGYDADHPNIALLRLRNFTMGRQLKDSEVTGKGGLDKIIDLFGTMTPFVSSPTEPYSLPPMND